jgi:hypothetical protein
MLFPALGQSALSLRPSIAAMFSCNVDEFLNNLPGVAFIDKAADWKAAPIGGLNMRPEHSGNVRIGGTWAKSC